MTQPDIDREDAAAIGFKVAEMAERVQVMHTVIPGARATWFFEADDVRFLVVVTVAAAEADKDTGANSTHSVRRQAILQGLVETYRAGGHEVFERDGVTFAKVVEDFDFGAAMLAEFNLDTLADQIDRRVK